MHRGRTATSFNASAFQRKAEGGDEEERRQRVEFLQQQREQREQRGRGRGGRGRHRYEDNDDEFVLYFFTGEVPNSCFEFLDRTKKGVQKNQLQKIRQLQKLQKKNLTTKSMRKFAGVK